MRRHWACPDCGFVLQDFEHGDYHNGIDCPRCKVHFSKNDFMDENCEKWSPEAYLEELEEQQRVDLEIFINSKKESEFFDEE